jgi:hypothetical protein
MTTAMAQPNGFLSPSIISNIVLKGDVSALSPTEKVDYYNHICERIGLDPATQPFQLLSLSGKQVMYATKGAAEQLTKLYGVSHEIRERATISDVHIVYVRATEVKTGRFEDSSGAVTISNLKGDALCNALMKAETKAKRRSTLSLLGLGMLDETEVETIPNAQPVPLLAAVPKNETQVDAPEPVKVTIGANKVVDATPEQARAIMDAQFGNRDGGKLKWEDEIMPLGKDANGKKFSQCTPFQLSQAIKAWDTDAAIQAKYPTLRQHIIEFTNDKGINL